MSTPGPTAIAQPRRPTGWLANAALLVPFAQVVVIFGLLAIWQMSSGRLVKALWVTDPIHILARLWEWVVDGMLFHHLLATLSAWAGGYAIGSLAGIICGFLLGMGRLADRVLAPYLAAFYGLPKLALLPLFVIGFGIGLQSKIALVATVAFFILLYATRDGVRDIDPDLVHMLKIMGAKRREILTKLLLPSTLPWIYTALRVSIGITLITTVSGETLSSNRGLGFLIASSASRFDTAGVFAAATILIVISLLVNALLTRSEASSRAPR